MRQVPQLSLHLTRLLQQPALALFAFLEGLLHRLPSDNFPVQPQVRVGQVLQAALRLFRLLAGGNVPETRPGTISASPAGQTADVARKTAKKVPPPFFRSSASHSWSLVSGEYLFQEGQKDRATLPVT